MRPLQLYLKGFIGIRSGLNREEIRLDLSSYHGLVAIRGPNGHGKTTLLDNMHPYLLMPFRSDGYSEGQFSYYEETYGDAEKALTWEHGGVSYRSDLFIKGSTKAKSMKAFLFVLNGDIVEPYTAPDGTKSDGKSTTYNRCIRAILGEPQMFFTAIFARQERKRLSDYPPGDMKLLLSDLLGLDHLMELSAAAMKRAGELQVQVDALEPRMRAYAQAQADLQGKETELLMRGTEGGTARLAQQQARAALSRAQQQSGEARARSLQRDENRRRRAAAQQAINAVDLDIQAANNRLRDDLAAAQRFGAAPELVQDIAGIVQRIESLGTRIKGYKTTLENAPDAEAADTALDAANTALGDCEGRLAAARTAAEALSDAPGALQALDSDIAALKREGTGVREAMEAAERQGALVDQVPCAGTEYNTKCELLASARGAKDMAAAKKTARDALLVRYRAAEASRPALTARVSERNAAAALVRSIEQERPPLQEALRRAQAAHRAAASVAEILTSHNAAVADLDAAQVELDGKKTAAAERQREGDTRVLTVQREHGEAQRGRQDRRAAAVADLEAIPAETGGNELSEAEQAVGRAEALVAQEDARVSAITQDIGRLESAILTARAAVATGNQSEGEMQRLTEDVAQWRLLSKALGKDGIVALAIDDAGPTISSLTNDLLMECYGPRFSIRFDTQSEKKDGSLKETFDIRVFDAERNDEKSVMKTSGGERIWINDALTRAIGLFLAQQSGRPYQTLFSDESDDGLDPDRKLHYMRMKRRVLAIGGYEVEYCITHTPALWEAADMVLDVSTLHAANGSAALAA